MKRSPLKPGKGLERKTSLSSRASLTSQTPMKPGNGLTRRPPVPSPREPSERPPVPRQAPRRTQSRTGPPKAVSDLVWARDGRVCVIAVTCHGQARDVALHHRRNRAMGGSTAPDTNRPPNLIPACGPCNRLMEGHGAAPGDLERFRGAGWKVSQGADPATIPLRYPDGSWWLLDDDGGRVEASPKRPLGVTGEER